MSHRMERYSTSHVSTAEILRPSIVGSGEIFWMASVNRFRSDLMTISPDGSQLFVSAISERPDAGVDVIDTATREIIGSFQTAEFRHDNVVPSAGEYVYNSSIGNILQPREVLEEWPDEANETVMNEPY